MSHQKTAQKAAFPHAPLALALCLALGGCAVAIVLTGGAIASDLVRQKPKPTPESILISCQRCWDNWPEWWCSLFWDCPEKPPDDGGNSATTTTKKPAKR